MKIEQALHGYEQGHTLLACSLNLKSQKDRKKMAILSDWTEYSRTNDSDLSYITAYPLPESSYYVVAKTWYADEKERPGSVWTHSLLLNLDQFNVVFDLRLLYDLFKRPQEKEGFSYYNNAIEIETDQLRGTKLFVDGFHIPSLAYWLEKLIINNESLIFSASESTFFNQAFILILMSHLPEGFWKEMSFCSGSGRLRQYEDKIFNLQFISNIRNKYPAITKDIKEKSENLWINIIEKSILEEDTNIIILLKRFTDDIGANICRFQTIIEVFSELDKLNKPGNENISIFENVLMRMAFSFPKLTDGGLFKKSILSKNMTKYFFDEDIFIYIMATTKYSESFDYVVFNFEERVEKYLKKHLVNEYVPVLEQLLVFSTKNRYKDIVLKKAILTYDKDQIEYIYTKHIIFYKYLIENNPLLLASDIWLNSDRDDFNYIFSVFIEKGNTNFENWNKLLWKLIKGKYKIGEKDIRLISNNYHSFVNDILDIINQGILVQKELIEYSKNSPKEIINWLKSQKSLNKSIIRLILDSMNPQADIVRSSTSIDWLPMLNVESDDMIELNTFLFILSYNWLHDDVAFRYYQKAFMPIYEATANNNISETLWVQVAAYCPKPFLGWEWDRCKLLRKGFAERFLFEKRNLTEIKTFTPYRKLNNKLMKAVKDRCKYRSS